MKLILSTSMPRKFLYSSMITASPTEASAAAIVIMNIAKICPEIASGVKNLEKATKLILTALNKSSIDIKTPTAFRRVKSPKIPMQNSADESIR